MVSDTSVDYLRDLSRVAFSIWLFILGYLIFRLFVVADGLNSDRDQFKQLVTNSCAVIENATNEVINMQKLATIKSVNELATVANNIDKSAMNALYSVVDLSCQISMAIIELVTGVLRCIPLTAASLTSNFINTNLPAVETMAQGFENSIIATANNELSDLLTQINSYTANIDSLFDAYNFLLVPFAVSYSVPPISIINIPNVGPETLDFSAINTDWVEGLASLASLASLQQELFNDIDPQSYLDQQLAKIPVYTLTSQQLIDSLNLQSDLSVRELTFCSQINFTGIDNVTNSVLTTVYVMIAILFLITVLLISVNILIVSYQHDKFKFSCCQPILKLKLKFNPTLKLYFRNMCYTPAVSCLLLGILGITVFTILLTTVSVAKQDFDRYVVVDIRNFLDVQIESLDAELAVVSQNFANDVNDKIDNLTTVLDEIRNGVNTTLNDIVGFQTTIKAYLNTKLAGINPIAGPALVSMIECMVSLLRLPLSSILDIVPNFNLPTISQDALEFNLTSATTLLNASLFSVSNYPFDYYDNMFQADREFYYFLTLYGFLASLIGFVSASWQTFTSSSSSSGGKDIGTKVSSSSSSKDTNVKDSDNNSSGGSSHDLPSRKPILVSVAEITQQKGSIY